MSNSKETPIIQEEDPPLLHCNNEILEKLEKLEENPCLACHLESRKNIRVLVECETCYKTECISCLIYAGNLNFTKWVCNACVKFQIAKKEAIKTQKQKNKMIIQEHGQEILKLKQAKQAVATGTTLQIPTGNPSKKVKPAEGVPAKTTQEIVIGPQLSHKKDSEKAQALNKKPFSHLSQLKDIIAKDGKPKLKSWTQNNKSENVKQIKETHNSNSRRKYYPQQKSIQKEKSMKQKNLNQPIFKHKEDRKSKLLVKNAEYVQVQDFNY